MCWGKRLGSIEHLRACKYGRAKHQLTGAAFDLTARSHGRRLKQRLDIGAATAAGLADEQRLKVR
jgi:hypothetical protein